MENSEAVVGKEKYFQAIFSNISEIFVNNTIFLKNLKNISRSDWETLVLTFLENVINELCNNFFFLLLLIILQQSTFELYTGYIRDTKKAAYLIKKHFNDIFTVKYIISLNDRVNENLT